MDNTEKTRPQLGSLFSIALIVAGISLVFACTAGWLSPERLTTNKLVASLSPPQGAALGHRRNHAKGICFTGAFVANGAGSVISTAAALAPGEYPAIGRFNLGSPDLYVKDATARVRGMGLQIEAHDGSLWRMAMIDLPFFPVATPQAFYELQVASASKVPGAMVRFATAHPEFAAFGHWLPTAPWTASFAEEQYNSINSFVFVDAKARRTVVRWSLAPESAVNVVPRAELEARDTNFLEEDIKERVLSGPVVWDMSLLVAGPDNSGADPSKLWTTGTRTLQAGQLIVKQVLPEADGPCRSINFDPTVLPQGIETSNDPFPAARAAAYRRSYDLRTSESNAYPRVRSETGP